MFTCIDRYTGCRKAISMVDATADSLASALLTGWVRNFGVPAAFTSDQGQQFESDLWHYSLMNLVGATRPASQRTTHAGKWSCREVPQAP